ncbi:hypothetical protein BH10BAC6_BH10BAC6_02760 [soil metagenome]
MRTTIAITFALATLLTLTSCVDERGNPINPSNPNPPSSAMAVVPDSIGMEVGGTFQFSTKNIDAVNVAWAMESGLGSISETGLYTAPASLKSASARARILAMDKRDSTKRAWGIVDLRDPTWGPPVDTNVCFTRDIMPLVLSNCSMAGCHDGTGDEARSLLNYTDIKTYVRNGSNGQPAASKSKLYTVLLPGASEPMPRDRAPLSAAQIALIKKWIDQGAKNTSCVELTCDTTSVTYADIDKIMTTNCTGGCHSGVAPSGGIDLTMESIVRLQVTVGNLIATVEQQPGVGPMPKGGAKLTDCDIARIRTWARTVK